MKLNFSVSIQNLHILYKILTQLNSLWKSGEQINLFFTEEDIVIYPDEKLAFDQIFGRVHIRPIPDAKTGVAEGFCKNYVVTSQCENNAVLITPYKFSEFMDSLKVMVEMEAEGEFKLTQRETTAGIKKYLQTGCRSDSEGEKFNYFIEIETIFDPKKYPENIIPKEISFEVSRGINENFFGKFVDRYNLLNEDSVQIKFCHLGFEEEKDEKEVLDSKLESDEYQIILQSQFIQSKLEDAELMMKLNESEKKKKSYNVTLTKTIFRKFFSMIKLGGNSKIGVDHEQSIDILYRIGDYKSITAYLEAASCNI
ncbi:unnamed protein product [Moneuplotes crassus]|uniref:Uncharacterized protein n=1 Tax=Euplotes crassus TaxID=5936 RepID=A0AAD1UQP4_EUPCR|nr:unnamed protein product [Moneuplotes crassus]